MSARGARAGRRRAQENHIELAMQAHDALHAEDIDRCHDHLHAILGVGQVRSDFAPLADGLKFDHDFRDLCVRHGIRAAYVVAEPVEAEGRARLCAGGDSDVCAVVRAALEGRQP